MEIKYNYNCSDDEAYQKIDTFLDGLVQEHGDLVSSPSKSWNESRDKMDFGFNAKGFDISGNMIIKDGKLTLNGKLPWVVKMFSDKIEEMVLKQLDELFPKKSGDYFG